MFGFVRKSSTKAFIADAVAEALKTRKERYELDNLELRRRIGELKDALDTARANQAELSTELHREIGRQIQQEREATEQIAKAVLSQVQAVQDSIPAPPEPVDLWPVHREIAELTDTVAYLLESPATVVERTVQAQTTAGTLAAFGWVRGMGAK